MAKACLTEKQELLFFQKPVEINLTVKKMWDKYTIINFTQGWS